MGVYKLSASGGLKTGRSTYTSMLAGNDVFDDSSDFLIQEVILTGPTASVTFDVSTLAAQGYKHLQIRSLARSSQGGVADSINVRFNGDTGTNYTLHNLIGDGSSVTSAAGTGRTDIPLIIIANSGAIANHYAGGITDILDAFSTSKNKTTRSLSGIKDSTVQYSILRSGLWLNTSALTSINLRADTGTNLLSGSRFSLYGSKG